MASISHPEVRAAAIKDYVDVARSIGADPYALLSSAGIDLSSTEHDDLKISASAVVRLYDYSSSSSGRDDFGLLMADRRGLSSLGPVGLLLRYQPSMRAVAERAISNMRLLNAMVQVHIDDDGEVAVIRFEVLRGCASRQIVESALALSCRILRELSDGRWRPERIFFRHSAPTSLAAHVRSFGCAISFDSEFDGIVCSSRALDIANPRGDAAMAAQAQRFIDMLALQQPSESVSGQVRHAICRLIGCGGATIERVAEHLEMHPRSLQRLLNQEGTSFGELLGETRRDLAVRYLHESNQSITEIAFLLGYSSISSFTRWFTEIFGQSPVAWRKAALGLSFSAPPELPRMSTPANGIVGQGTAERRAAAA